MEVGVTDLWYSQTSSRRRLSLEEKYQRLLQDYCYFIAEFHLDGNQESVISYIHLGHFRYLYQMSSFMHTLNTNINFWAWRHLPGAKSPK